MSGVKVVLSELGVGCWIPACWGPSCRGKCGSWLWQQEQGKYLCHYHTSCCWAKPWGWYRIFTIMHFFHNHLITEAIESDVGFPGGSDGKEHACQGRRHWRHGFDSWVGSIPYRRNSNPLQYSCLKNPMDKGAWWSTVHGVAESEMTKRLSTHTLYAGDI